MGITPLRSLSLIFLSYSNILQTSTIFCSGASIDSSSSVSYVANSPASADCVSPACNSTPLKCDNICNFFI